MLQFCANPGCDRYEEFIPSGKDKCPDCGGIDTSNFRLATSECPGCGEENPSYLMECWRCGNQI